MFNDQTSDLLTRIRNAQRANHKVAMVCLSKMNERILEVLKREGFIGGFETVETGNKFGEKKQIRVELKYYPSGKPAISVLRRFSKCGRREYRAKDAIPKVNAGLGIAVISTSRGVISDREAKQMGVGGEVLAMVG